jgi:hypothetical protein
MNDWSDQETDDPLYADDRNFYKVEKWTRDGTKVDSLLYAGNSLGRARSIFEQAIKHRLRIRLTAAGAGTATVAATSAQNVRRAAPPDHPGRLRHGIRLLKSKRPAWRHRRQHRQAELLRRLTLSR